MELHRFTDLKKGLIIKRPSSSIKTPYIADVLIDQEQYLAHSPSLGCCGLADAHAYVLLEKNSNPKAKSQYVIVCACYEEQDKNNNQIIGIHPKLAETLVHQALLHHCLSQLGKVSQVKREVCFKNSRFDFVGLDENQNEFILEVKSAPLADYEDIYAKDRKKKCYDHIDASQKVSYFPDGYRKKLKDTVSPRALKHIHELTEIKLENPHVRCICCFVIQRTDVIQFQPSVIDQIYRSAVQRAWLCGVEIYTLQVEWNRMENTTSAHFVSDTLPVTLFDTYGPFMMPDIE